MNEEIHKSRGYKNLSTTPSNMVTNVIINLSVIFRC